MVWRVRIWSMPDQTNMSVFVFFCCLDCLPSSYRTSGDQGQRLVCRISPCDAHTNTHDHTQKRAHARARAHSHMCRLWMLNVSSECRCSVWLTKYTRDHLNFNILVLYVVARTCVFLTVLSLVYQLFALCLYIYAPTFTAPPTFPSFSHLYTH